MASPNVPFATLLVAPKCDWNWSSSPWSSNARRRLPRTPPLLTGAAQDGASVLAACACSFQFRNLFLRVALAYRWDALALQYTEFSTVRPAMLELLVRALREGSAGRVAAAPGFGLRFSPTCLPKLPLQFEEPLERFGVKPKTLLL